ncbi:MAG: 5'-methylthioadenosine/S-adenosylhomocysteine nucleosidase, partial [Chloroflexi bacterium]|nr:5'-methylthioadenosine/S-adenosylhomocysteine nucleosidase [Chloroflexota bacterium]
QSTPLGETFDVRPLTYFHGGWGKISAAATTQYAIDHFHPDLLVNLGTCGGFEGRIATGTVILVEKTIVYDILEQMSDPDEAVAYYATEIDLSWLDTSIQSSVFSGQSSILRGLLVSADRDILPADIPGLVEKYEAVAADWESGAIAWVAKRNGVRCLILRGVTDLVGAAGGEAYGNIELFHERTREVMKQLVEQLPEWILNANVTDTAN